MNKTYSDNATIVKALEDVQLSLDFGKSYALVGDSGSGKSTFLHIIGCLDAATSGEIILGDKCISKMSSNARTELRAKEIGFIFQNYYLNPILNVLDNVAMALIINGVSRKKAIEEAKKAIYDVGLEKRLYHYADQLSGGEKQRVAIARAIVKKPKLLIADEPTGNLDSRTTARIIELMIAMQKKFSMTLILVTHNMDLARRMDSCLQITDGRISVVSA